MNINHNPSEEELERLHKIAFLTDYDNLDKITEMTGLDSESKIIPIKELSFGDIIFHEDDDVFFGIDHSSNMAVIARDSGYSDFDEPNQYDYLICPISFLKDNFIQEGY